MTETMPVAVGTVGGVVEGDGARLEGLEPLEVQGLSTLGDALELERRAHELLAKSAGLKVRAEMYRAEAVAKQRRAARGSSKPPRVNRCLRTLRELADTHIDAGEPIEAVDLMRLLEQLERALEVHGC